MLVATMIALPVAVGTFAASATSAIADNPASWVAHSLGPSVQAAASFEGTPILQSPTGNHTMGIGEWDEIQPTALADAEADLVAALPVDAEFSMALSNWGTAVQFEGLNSLASLQQRDLSHGAVADMTILSAGRLPAEGEVALCSNLAAELGAAVGVQINVRAEQGAEFTPYTLVGLLDTLTHPNVVLFDATGPLSPPDPLDPHSPDFRRVDLQWFISGPPVTWDDVQALNAAGFWALSREVLLDPPAEADVPLWAMGHGEPMSNDIPILVAAAAAVALLLCALLIGPAFAVAARNSSRSLALIAASGASPRTLRTVVVGSGAVLGALGAAIGAAIGLAATAMMAVVRHGGIHALRTVSVPWPLVAAIAALGLLTAIAASLLPARGAAKADVVAVLAGRRGQARANPGVGAVGLIATGVGLAACLVGALTQLGMLLIAGSVVGLLGVVATSGIIVALLGHLASALPLTWRFAFRDAARNRARTAPALAAVMIACVGATAGLIFLESSRVADARSRVWAAAEDSLLVTLQSAMMGEEARTSDHPAYGLVSDEDGFTPTGVAMVEEAIRSVAPSSQIIPVETFRFDPGSPYQSLWVEPPPVNQRATSTFGSGVQGVTVSAGSNLEALGIPEPQAGREALADGLVLAHATDVWPGGFVRFLLVDAEGAVVALDLPAHPVGEVLDSFNQNLPVLPPSMAADLGGHPVAGGLVALADRPFNWTQSHTVTDALLTSFGVDEWGVNLVAASPQARDWGTPAWIVSAIVAGGAAVLALAAAWTAAALAATESRPDLATFAAVGAPPRTRRRITGAQAGTIAFVGAVVGTGVGLAVGAAFVLWQRYSIPPEWGGQVLWTVSPPWQLLGAFLVGLPVLAVCAAWLCTRSTGVISRRFGA